MGWLSLEGAIYRAPTVLIIIFVDKSFVSKARRHVGENVSFAIISPGDLIYYLLINLLFPR